MFGGFTNSLIPFSTRVGPLFDDPLPGLPALHFGGLFDQFDRMEGFGPRLQLHESDAALELEFDVPRYKKEELHVDVNGHVLTVSGKRAVDRREGRVALFQESPLTEFTRSLRIPRVFDLSKLTHTLDGGVLYISIPRIIEAPPQPIDVVATAAQQSADSAGAVANVPDNQVALDLKNWPPTVRVNDTVDTLEYVCPLPPFIAKDDLKLQVHHGMLDFSVGHTQRVQKKDREGNVVYESQQSVNYSTPLALPSGTSAQDISTNFDNGVLTVKVHKHANPSQNVPVA